MCIRSAGATVLCRGDVCMLSALRAPSMPGKPRGRVAGYRCFWCINVIIYLVYVKCQQRLLWTCYAKPEEALALLVVDALCSRSSVLYIVGGFVVPTRFHWKNLPDFPKKWMTVRIREASQPPQNWRFRKINELVTCTCLRLTQHRHTINGIVPGQSQSRCFR